MKNFWLLTILLYCTIGFAQNGKIYPKSGKYEPGKPNVFVYEPAYGMEIPEAEFIGIYYKNQQVISYKKTALIKNENQLEFHLKIKDSIPAVLFFLLWMKKTIRLITITANYIITIYCPTQNKKTN
jgi:hypothetical protein